MASKKYKITQLQNDETLLELRPETDADIVNVETGEEHYKGQATDVQGALEELYDMAETGGVTSVNGQTGAVELDAEDVGAQPNFNDGSATIATEVGGVITIKAGVTQTGGTISNNGSASDIVLGTAAKKSFTTNVTDQSTDNELPTAKAVHDAIDALPEPMIFKGSLGTAGTISVLPAASSSNEGFTYKVITAGTYASQAAKVGDVFISNGSAWILIPAGDEPSGTVTSVGAQGASGSHIVVSGGPITSSGTLEVAVAEGYSIPSDDKQSDWDDKYDLPETGMPKTDLAQEVKDSLNLADSALQTHQTVTLSGDASGTSNNGAITVTLANTGVAAGSYSAVTVDTKGRVTAGAQILEVGATGQTVPGSGLAVGGLFFKQI